MRPVLFFWPSVARTLLGGNRVTHRAIVALIAIQNGKTRGPLFVSARRFVCFIDSQRRRSVSLKAPFHVCLVRVVFLVGSGARSWHTFVTSPCGNHITRPDRSSPQAAAHRNGHHSAFHFEDVGRLPRDAGCAGVRLMPPLPIHLFVGSMFIL